MGIFNDDSASRAAKEARSIISDIHVPTIEEARAELLKYVQQGILTPQQAETVLQDETSFSQIMEDPQLRAAQIDALNRYGNIVDKGGLDAQAEADLFAARNEMQTANRGAQDAIMANARARGVGGSDLEFTNRLIAQQGAATRGAASGVQAAADAERRRDAALAAMEQVGGRIRSQDYAKQAAEAEARDTINRFNTANRQSQINLNTQAANQAQAANLGQKQDVANRNVIQANEVPQQVRDMEFRKAQALAGAQQAVGNARASENTALRRDIMGGVKLVGQATGLLSDERAKEDVKPFDVGRLLDDITGVKFRYKPETGQPREEMAGVLAQDVEKEAPGAVSEGPDGLKRIDPEQLGGIMLAALADVNTRLRALEGTPRG